jgi:hypothetical protein
MDDNGVGRQKIKVLCVSPIAQTPNGVGGRVAMIGRAFLEAHEAEP